MSAIIQLGVAVSFAYPKTHHMEYVLCCNVLPDELEDGEGPNGEDDADDDDLIKVGNI